MTLVQVVALAGLAACVALLVSFVAMLRRGGADPQRRRLLLVGCTAAVVGLATQVALLVASS